MKELKFKTSKGEFILVDYDHKELFSKFLLNVFKKYKIQNNHKRYKLSEITEEQASEIVYYGDEFTLKNYNSAKDKLFKVLKSKGIHLYKNPYTPKINPLDYRKAEQKTFHNPYIFKIND